MKLTSVSGRAAGPWAAHPSATVFRAARPFGRRRLDAWWLATTNRWRTTPALHRSPNQTRSLQSDQRTL